MKRWKMNRRHSKRNFSKNADRIHRFNMITNPERGGIRL